MQKIKKIIKEMFSRKRTIENINNISYTKLKEILKENTDTIILDVRSPQEYNEGHIASAINIPEYEILTKVNNIIQNKNAKIIVYCASGSRSKKAIKILK
ncbi:MAG: rhodanese-like domain-containing protein, partial [Clostridia bacterium]|nr:rhodanese-like domain-containing protein [Clostridia bacterium]